MATYWITFRIADEVVDRKKPGLFGHSRNQYSGPVAKVENLVMGRTVFFGNLFVARTVCNLAAHRLNSDRIGRNLRETCARPAWTASSVI